MESFKQSILIDDQDRWLLEAYNWYKSQQGYVVAWHSGATILIHRIIMEAQKGQMVDHIDGNPFNNRRSNLRLTDYHGNGLNRKTLKPNRRSRNSSNYRGVRFNPVAGKFQAQITWQRKAIHLGTFESEEEASKVYEAKRALLIEQENYANNQKTN